MNRRRTYAGSTWTGNVLRCLADRIDHRGAPRRPNHLSFTIEPGIGVVTNTQDRGCPLWYLGPADYERAHTETRAEAHQ